MPYPETAEGFMVHDTKKWSEFKKGEVRLLETPRQKKMSN